MTDITLFLVICLFVLIPLGIWADNDLKGGKK